MIFRRVSPPHSVAPVSPWRAMGGRARAALALGATALCALACGYRLAGRNQVLPEDVRRIAIPVFQNETRRAEIEQRITEALLEEFVRRGDFRTQPGREGADAVLDGAVTAYRSVPVTLDEAGRSRRVEVVVQARARLTDLRTGAILWSQEHFVFRGQYDVDPDSAGFFDREIEAIEQISRDFAETIVTSLLEGF